MFKCKERTIDNMYEQKLKEFFKCSIVFKVEPLKIRVFHL